MEFTELEYEVITWLLAGDDPILQTLRRQFTSAYVSSRNLTGVGVIVTLSVEHSAPKVIPPSIQIGDVGLQVKNVPNGAGAILFVRDGLLDYLDIYTYADPWPDNAQLLSIGYFSQGIYSSERDFTSLRKGWNASG